MIRHFAVLALAGGVAMAAEAPTFNKDVLPILQKNCQACHRPGDIGPMSFLTYESTRPWAKSIKTAVVSHAMPPWFADPQYGHFKNDRRLVDADVAKIAAWVDAGAPEGEAKDRPEPVEWRDGWNIQPDLVFEMPKAYRVPAKGTIEYTYFVMPTKLTKDTWVVNGEVRPGNRAVVHHASVHVRPPGSQWLKDAKVGEPYVPPAGPDGKKLPALVDPRINMKNEWLLGYAPGVHADYFDLNSDSAKLIPAGSDLVFEIHYTANGKEVDDRTKVGLVLAKETPKHRLLTVPVVNMNFAIPPGAANHEARAMASFNAPVELVYSQPHMHLRGKAMDIKLLYPSGESEMVVSVPRFDFNWQLVYYEQKPKALPKGTRMELVAHWDNSANNKSNPDPAQKVVWGDQSWEEMLFAWVGVVVDRDVDPDTVVAQLPVK